MEHLSHAVLTIPNKSLWDWECFRVGTGRDRGAKIPSCSESSSPTSVDCVIRRVVGARGVFSSSTPFNFENCAKILDRTDHCEVSMSQHQVLLYVYVY